MRSSVLDGQIGSVMELIGRITDIAARTDIRVRHRDFTRDGPLDQRMLVTLLLFMVGDANRRGYAHLLDQFWDQCASHGITPPTAQRVSASAFSQARQKLPLGMLREVLHGAAAKMEDAFPKLSRWHGRRVFAVDGAKQNVQRSDELFRCFGRPEGGHCPQATVSTLLNVMSEIPYDIAIGPYGSCERSLLMDHIAVLRRSDVLVMDRGYPSHEVLRILLGQGIDFLVRVPADSSFEAIDVFRSSGSNDSRVVIAAARDPRRGAEPIELRAVKITAPDGEDAYFLTSLRRSEFSRSAIAKLYRKRWEVEEHYKLEKSSYFDQRQFHGRTALGVQQEIAAQAIYVVVARFLLAAAAKHVEAPYHDLSIKSSVLALSDYLTRLALDAPHAAATWLPRLLARIAKTRDKRRPGRSCPRRSFKPGPRWGPSGRRGA